MDSCSSQADDESFAPLSSPDARVRLTFLRDLCPCHVKRHVPAIWDRILPLVCDPDPKVRSTALHILADGSPRERAEEIAWAIGTMVNDPDLKLRRRVRRVLSAYRRTASVNTL